MFPIPVTVLPNVSKPSQYEMSRNDKKGGLSPSTATVEGCLFKKQDGTRAGVISVAVWLLVNGQH